MLLYLDKKVDFIKSFEVNIFIDENVRNWTIKQNKL